MPCSTSWAAVAAEEAFALRIFSAAAMALSTAEERTSASAWASARAIFSSADLVRRSTVSCSALRVWIDLTNSPHVLVMRPVIETLRARGDEVLITARDIAQTLGLLERFRLDHTAIGHHRGGKLAAKGLGLLSRSGALTRWASGRTAPGS